ncbi:Mu transposase C-terminal domain-containing protein [Agarivorans gilvus]|nr:Mu transposase C-terminal domain-containing protein [Agarivorans gilvus]
MASSRHTLGLFDDEYDSLSAESIESFSKETSDLDNDHLSPDFDSYSKEQQREALRRYALIQWVDKRLKGGWTEKKLSPLLEQATIEFDFTLPNWRTLSRWYSSYINSGHSLEALLPKHHKKGGTGARKMEDGFFFEKAIEEYYLTRERPTIADCYELYKSWIVLENSKLISGKLKPVCQRTFYNRINKLSPYLVALRRFGKPYADRHFRTVKQLKKPSNVLERVEIDHTPLDLILVDDELLLPLGRPYLTALMDSYSGCIVGFYIGYREPSYDSVRRALSCAYLPKHWVKERFPSIKKEWPCEGKIGMLVVDNAAEFWSSSLDDACAGIVQNVDYNQVARPWLKPMIERFFSTVNKKLLISIPGKTFSSIQELKDYKPEKDAVMRFSTFMELFHKWLIDEYHYRPDTRETKIPIVQWCKGTSLVSPPTYEANEAERLLIELAKVNERSVLHDGIHIHKLRYVSDELTEYRKRKSPETGAKHLKVKVKTIHTSIAYIFVFLQSEQRYIKVPCVDQEYASGLSLLQHQTNQRFVRSYVRSSVDTEHLAECKVYLHERIRKEAEALSQKVKRKNPKIGGMKKMAKYHNIGSDSGNGSITAAQAIQTQTLLANNTKPTDIEDLDWENFELEDGAY